MTLLGLRVVGTGGARNYSQGALSKTLGLQPQIFNPESSVLAIDLSAIPCVTMHLLAFTKLNVELNTLHSGTAKLTNPATITHYANPVSYPVLIACVYAVLFW